MRSAREVTVVELSDGLMPGTDRDLVRPLQKRIEKRYAKILLGTRVAMLEPHRGRLCARPSRARMRPRPQDFDRVLVAVGRSANGNAIDAAAAGVAVDSRGIIAVDKQMRTNVPHIFAIGDIAGAPMLAHKATHEAKVAAEVAAGHKSSFDARCIPVGGLHRSGNRLGGRDRDRGQGARLEYGKGVFPVGGERRSLAHQSRRGLHQAAVRHRTRPHHRRRHRRQQRRAI